MSRATALVESIEHFVEKVNPAKEKEIRTAITAYSKELHKWFQKKAGDVKINKKVIPAKGSKVVNPFIEMRVKDWRDQSISNDLRAEIAKAMGVSPKNSDDVRHGNIQKEGIVLAYRDWTKMFPDAKAPKEGYSL